MSEVLKQKIRRDLSRWSRKLLLAIGLEDIGRELVGQDEWKRLYPLSSDWERDTTSDFDPTQVPEQYFDITDLSHIDPSETPEEVETNEENNDLLENFFHLLPYWYFINRAFGVSGAGSENINEDLSNRNPISEALNAQRLNCLLFLQSVKHQQLQVQSTLNEGFENLNNIQNLSYPSAESFDGQEASASGTRYQVDNAFIRNFPLCLSGLSESHSAQDDADQPLDLTQKATQVNRASGAQYRLNINAETNNYSVEDNKSSQLRLNKSNSSVRGQRSRGYTSQELEAALKDIQSGKLGTRRAAVIYGIPRSTLRNKVYKLGKDRSRSYFRPRSGSKRLCAEESVSSTKSSPTEELIGNSLYRVGLNCEIQPKLDLLPASFTSNPSSQSQGNFTRESTDEVEIQENEGVKPELDISHEKKVLKEWLRSKMIRQGLTQNISGNECLHDGDTGRSLSERKDIYSDSSDNGDSDGFKEDPAQEVILKIPSLLHTKSSLNRLMISKQKLKRRQGNEDLDSAFVSVPQRTFSSDSTTVRSGSQKILKLHHYVENSLDGSETDAVTGTKYNETAFSNNSGRSACSYRRAPSMNRDNTIAPTDSNGKKSRPKRGKYRNYDRDALLKAVRAVQNGEMSVHRAGSFYGVPHSTLEYKVKERHLLRRTKKDGGSPKIQKSSPDSSLSESDQPLSSNNFTKSVTSSHTHGGSRLPLPSNFRETLSRYLNIDEVCKVNSHSAPISPDSSGKMNQAAKDLPADGNYQRVGEDVYNGAETGYSSNVNVFQFEKRPRQNLENLLDLSKKSE